MSEQLNFAALAGIPSDDPNHAAKLSYVVRTFPPELAKFQQAPEPAPAPVPPPEPIRFTTMTDSPEGEAMTAGRKPKELLVTPAEHVALALMSIADDVAILRAIIGAPVITTSHSKRAKHAADQIDAAVTRAAGFLKVLHPKGTRGAKP